MANICNNEFYLTSSDFANIKYAKEWFENSDLDCYTEIIDDDCIEVNFSSKWTFPDELMQKFVDGIPNKEDIYIRIRFGKGGQPANNKSSTIRHPNFIKE